MAEEKKDLTGLLQYSKKLEDEGKAPPIPEGSVMEEVPIEKIDEFESLEAYSNAHPFSESPTSPLPPSDSQLLDPPAVLKNDPPDEASPPPSDFENSPPSPEPAENLFEETPGRTLDSSESSGPLESLDSVISSDSVIPSTDLPSSDFLTSSEFPSSEGFLDTAENLNSNDFITTNKSEPGLLPLETDSGDLSATASPFAVESLVSAENEAKNGKSVPVGSVALGSVSVDNKLETSDLLLGEAVVLDPPLPTLSKLTPPSPKSPATTVEKIKKFSEKIAIGKPGVSASFPFSLLITGNLLSEEKDKLLEILNRENMGFREIDLEPQLASGRILIPRISEFAGILLVQALRGTRAQMRLGPSDSIFSTTDTRTDPEEISDNSENKVSFSSDIVHPAESIPVTAASKIPDAFQYTLVDTLTATAVLKSKTVEAENSAEYQEILEALQRELKYKAYRRGADAIVYFKIQMNSLSSPTHYRLVVSGSAVRKAEKRKESLVPSLL